MLRRVLQQCTLLHRRVHFISDVIISRRSSGSKSGSRLITEYITYNCNWVVPDGVRDNEFSVRIFGAGGDSFNGKWEEDLDG